MVLELIRRVRDRGLPVILISHNMPQVFEIADRIHIQRLGPPRRVGQDARHQDVGRGGDHDRRDGVGQLATLVRDQTRPDPRAKAGLLSLHSSPA